MGTLDFSELDKEPPGEAFEGLIRLVGERLGLVVQWTGRGSDGGRDLIFSETQVGPLQRRVVKWLVNCKDKSGTGSSVAEKDVGSIMDKIRQHHCDGFLLATTTTASTALKEKLDELDLSSGGPVQTKVWDRFELTQILTSEKCADLMLQFFPKQNANRKIHSLDTARQIIEASLPRFIGGKVRRHLVSFEERRHCLFGDVVWPHESDQALIIDDLREDAIRQYGLRRAAEKLQDLHFEPFMAFVDALVRNFPEQAKNLLIAVVKSTTDEGIKFNAIEILREDEDFSLGDEIQITRLCDADTLDNLYQDVARDLLNDNSVWDWRLPPEVQRCSDVVELLGVEVDSFIFEGGDVVSLSGNVAFRVLGYSSDPEEPPIGEQRFQYLFEGHFESDGIEIDSIK